MAFLGIGKKKQEKRAQAAQQTIDKIIALGQPLSEYDKMNMIYASDGKIDSKEKKLLKKYVKQENKTERVDIRQDARTERTTVRQSQKTSRVHDRTEARKVAYEHGIDPTANLVNAIGNGLGQVAGPVASIINPGAGLFGGTQTGGDITGQLGGSLSLPAADINGDGTNDTPKLLLIGVAVVALVFLFRRKRRR